MAPTVEKLRELHKIATNIREAVSFSSTTTSTERKVQQGAAAAMGAGYQKYRIGPRSTGWRQRENAQREARRLVAAGVGVFNPAAQFSVDRAGSIGRWGDSKQGRSTCWIEQPLNLVDPHNLSVITNPVYTASSWTNIWTADKVTHYRNNSNRSVQLEIWSLWPRDDIPAFPGDDDIAVRIFTDIVNDKPNFGIADPEPPRILTVGMNQRGVELISGVGNVDINYFTSPYDSLAICTMFKIKMEVSTVLKPGDTCIVRSSLPRKFDWNPVGDLGINENAAAANIVNALQEQWAYFKKQGPCYYFRIRGEVIHNNALDGDDNIVPGSATSAQATNTSAHYLDWIERITYTISIGSENDFMHDAQGRINGTDLSAGPVFTLANEHGAVQFNTQPSTGSS